MENRNFAALNITINLLNSLPYGTAFKKWLPLAAVSVLTLVYLANCLTPFRLTNDTVRYVNIKEWMEAGRPAGSGSANDFLPYGYVWFLMLLEKLGLKTRGTVLESVQKEACGC